MHEDVAKYLSLRRAGGFILRDPERHLFEFAAFATSRGEGLVRSSTAIDWAAQAGTARQSHRKLQSLVLFARHMYGEDPRHEIPPAGVFAYPRTKPLPHIYTPDEARKLVDAAACLGRRGSNRGATIRTLLALLFATGLRISEALRLRLSDFSEGTLVIRQTKFRKTRLVPLHMTAVAGLSEYLEGWRRGARANDPVFINVYGKPLSYKAVQGSWGKTLATAELQEVPGRKGFRIHDIRHTFAVRALEAAPNSRDHISRHMLAVSTYLGHANVADTYWYFHATPALMAGIADACQRDFEGGQS